MFRGILAGLGGRGLNWDGIVRDYEGCEIVAYVEPDEARRRCAAREHDVPESKLFPSLDDAIAETDADFVLDVTPPAVHCEIAEKAFAAGLHVLGEKPLSDDCATAVRMVAMGTNAGLKHMITQNYRFNACPRTMRKLLAEDIIGKPGQCDIRFYMNWADIPGSHYVLEPYMFMKDMMVHHFDMVRYVLALDPVSVQAVTWNHPWGWHAGDAAHAVVLEFPDGLWATHVAVGCAVGARTSWDGDWRIEGPKGTLSWEGGVIRHAHLHRTDNPADREIPLLDVPRDCVAILDEFFDAINEDREPECSAADNIKSLAMVFAAVKSTEEGRRVRMDELA